jgi:hypothetical protein
LTETGSTYTGNYSTTALDVTGAGTEYRDTDITLINDTASASAYGASVDGGATLLLTGGTIRTTDAQSVLSLSNSSTATPHRRLRPLRGSRRPPHRQRLHPQRRHDPHRQRPRRHHAGRRLHPRRPLALDDHATLALTLDHSTHTGDLAARDTVALTLNLADSAMTGDATFTGTLTSGPYDYALQNGAQLAAAVLNSGLTPAKPSETPAGSPTASLAW